MKSLIIGPEAQNQRIDKFVRKYLSEAPLSFIYKLFRKKDVKINGHWVDASYIVKVGDQLSIYVTDLQLKEFAKPKPVDKIAFNRQIIYEDSHVLIVNKPSGLLVHGDENEKKVTLQNEVLSYLIQNGEYNTDMVGFTPAPAHRLDRNTSGLIIFAKDLPSLQVLEKLFKDKNDISKEYYALVAGHTEEKGTIDLPLLKDEKAKTVKVSYKNGQVAKTVYQTERHFHDSSLLRVNILTGRTHQIRVHMQAIDHPVIGDNKYGDFSINKKYAQLYGLKHQFLFARSLSFANVSSPLEYLSNRKFVCPWPEEEKIIIDKLTKE